MWNVIGPLVGVVIGALLTPWISWRWQHRQWVMDNKKQEYRDLLDGLIQASEGIIRARPNASGELTTELLNAVWLGRRVIRDRIFVARTINSRGINEDWDVIGKLAVWEAGEEKMKIGERSWQYTVNAIVILRNELDEKLRAIIQQDLDL
ncbi:MAG TPA: hypothetical protein VNV41_07515 [Candidatus Acidoferrales bacterium]|nr:hypothetical protein [Candidatus Acidoferrales bacterium]